MIKDKKILKKQDGFSLVELLIVMALFTIVLTISANTFTLILKQSTQQSRQAETQMERIVGTELLRVDIENAGYGLPWYFKNTITYNEAASLPASNYNDSSGNAPRAVVSGNNTGTNRADELVIKATSVATSNASQRWTYIMNGTTNPNSWASNNLTAGDRVIVIQPKASESKLKQLVMSGATFYTSYVTTGFASGFIPVNPGEMYLVYGVDPDTNLRFPFNRADYYISTSSVPSFCAPNTGVLVKSVISQSDGSRAAGVPILDCVADMQVVFRLDMNEDGTVGTSANADGSTVSSSEGATASTVQSTLASAELLRKRLKEVRVYILTHDGQLDRTYTYPSSTVNVYGSGEATLGSTFNLSSTIGTDWQNYRWKVITVTARPKNLM